MPIYTLPGDANEPALELLAKIVSQAGGTITIYAPNREQIDATDAIAPIHAKLILYDKVKAYIGSANLSKGGLQNALEIGVIHQGPAIDQLVDYIDWVFECSEKWD